MNIGQERTRSASERFIGLDGPTYGDERERAVLMEAATFGLTIGIFVNLGVALVASVLGALALPTVLILITAIPAWSMSWYSRRRKVDMEKLAFRGNPMDRVWTLVTVFGGMLLVVGAMVFTVFTGNGLVNLPTLDVIGPDASGIGASVVRGAAIGALAGLAIGLVAMLFAHRRKARKTATSLPDDEDE